MSTTWAAVCAFAEQFPDVEPGTDDGRPVLTTHGVEFLAHYAGEHGMRILVSPGEKKVLIDSHDPAMYLMEGDDEYHVRMFLDEIYLDEIEDLLRESHRIAKARAQR